MIKSFKEQKELKKKQEEGKAVEVNDEITTLEVSKETNETSIDKDSRVSFEEFKVLYKGQIDDKCLEDYGSIEDKKLWEDTAKELFLSSENYIPNEDAKVEKIEESKLEEAPRLNKELIAKMEDPNNFGELYYFSTHIDDIEKVIDNCEDKKKLKKYKDVLKAARAFASGREKKESLSLKEALKNLANKSKKTESIEDGASIFELKFDCSNEDTFGTGDSMIGPLADTLRGVVEKVEIGKFNGPIMDANGNKIGSFGIGYQGVQSGLSESFEDDLEKAKEDSKKKGLYIEDTNLPNITSILENYDWEVDITTQEQLGMDYSYRKLCTSVNDAERFNYHSDYWGDAETYQQDNIELMEQVEPYVGKEVVVDFDDGSVKYKILGIVIDKQYNSLSHTCILAEELGETKTEDHQLYYDDIQGMPTSERHLLWKQYHEEDFEDSEEGNNKFWDWAEEEFPMKEIEEESKSLKEGNALDFVSLVDNLKRLDLWDGKDETFKDAVAKYYEIIETDKKLHEGVEEEINVTDANEDINSVMVTYISNQTFMKYYNLERPLKEKELDTLKLKIKNKEMYVTDFKDKLNAIEVNSRKELIPNTYVMKIRENDEEDLEESKKIEESQVSDYTFKELNKVINDKGNDFKLQISGSEDKTKWLNIDKEDLKAIYQALQNKNIK